MGAAGRPAFLINDVVSQTVNYTAGSGSFKVPNYNVLTIRVWGGGGGGGSITSPSGSPPVAHWVSGFAGGNSAAYPPSGTMVGLGGGPGNYVTPPADGGGSYGGYTNIAGHPASYSVSQANGGAGGGPNGGAGGESVLRTGVAGYQPGGGGSGGSSVSHYLSGGGGGGGYSAATFTPAVAKPPAPGSTIAWEIGTGGNSGGYGGYVTGGAGAAGKVQFVVT